VKVADNRQILDAITADPRYLANLDWGKPRAGHPEGTVRVDGDQGLGSLLL